MLEILRDSVAHLSFGYVVVVLLFSLVALLYWLALPKPYPGIPHHAASARSITGDLPALIKHVTSTKENVDWITNQCVELNSPIVQLFLRPFSKPLIILSDHHEGYNILSRRTREFDRAVMTAEAFNAIIPDATIGMPSHEKFKSQRRIWSGTMTSNFLNEVAAPRVHSSTLGLLQLWRKKTELADGHPFRADGDVRLTALDAIWAVTLGSELGGITSQIEFLDQLSSIQLSRDKESAAEIPSDPAKPVVASVSTLLESFEFSAPFPRIRQFFVNRTSWFRKAWGTKEQTITTLLEQSRQKFAGQSAADTEKYIYSAMDQVLGREAAALAKAGTSSGNNRAMHDELFMFLLAGHETTATTLSWAFKYLADDAESQNALRHTLQQAFPEVLTRGVMPSATAIMTTDIPHLEATMSETLRVSRTASAVVRQATTDCLVLGYRIPKGADIMISLSGVSYLHGKDLPVDEQKRHSAPSRSNGHMNGDGSPAPSSKPIPAWPLEGKLKFQPSRWLIEHDDGTAIYDPNAGPMLPFSAGPRGCFGKKLAMLELRIVLVLVLLSFRLEKVPEALNSYAANEKITRQPQQCFVRLVPV